jgi:2-dehydropantoate 2-reductase
MIAIYGAGSMGTALGAYLTNAGLAIDLISRDKEHVTALKTTGAKIEGTASFSAPAFDGENGRALAMLPEEVSKKYDIIFLLTKQTDNAANAQILQSHLAPKGVICTMQNGLPEPPLAEILGAERVIGCICTWGATKTAPGVISLTSNPKNMSFGLSSLNNAPLAVLKEIQSILEKMCPVTIEHNFIGARWSKLLINAAFSGISTITGMNFGEIASKRRSRSYAILIIKECIAVCTAAKVKIEPIQGKDIVRLMKFANIILPIAMRKHKAIKSGMLRDIERGRTCEIENINGVVSRWGKKYNVPTPVNDKIIEVVHAIERGERKYGRQNLLLL